MKLQGRGLYNLLRLNSGIDGNLQIVPWKTANYREFSTDELWKALKKLGIVLDSKTFALYAENASSPEELTEYLWVEEDDFEGEEKAYLILFELWRRLLPEKPCISIFCDELDFLIEEYDQKNLNDINILIDHLAELENILDEHVDQGSPLDEVFAAICEFCAHDIEIFLYDFAFDLIAAKDTLTASELIEGFYEYVADKRWFDLLRSELMFATDSEEAILMLRRILETLQENPNNTLHFEVLYVASKNADKALFKEIFSQIFYQIETEEELHELLNVLMEFLHYQDMEGVSSQIEHLIESRKHNHATKKISDKAQLKESIEPLLQNF